MRPRVLPPTARAALALAALLLLAPAAAQEGPALEPLPPDGALVHTTTPELGVRFPPAGSVEVVRFVLDGQDLQTDGSDEVRANATHAVHQVASFLPLRDGVHNVTVALRLDGVEVEASWSFQTTSAPPPREEKPFPLALVLGLALGGLAVLGAGFGVTLFVLYKTRGFTLRKWFARHPVQRQYLTLYVPLGVGIVGTLVALALTADVEQPRFLREYLVLAGFAVALGPYALDVQRAERRRLALERAFGQFLYELADALRGGIDPLKALMELAKTERGLLRKPLRAAADQIRLGKPFETVLRNMVRPMRSPLVSRYADLVGEAAGVGGEIAGVVYRAAKDVDELVKLDQERARQMKTPVVTMYIAFGVLLLMVSSMMEFAPNLGRIDIGSLSGDAPLAEGADAPVPRLALDKLQTRFFHLVLINSFGAGLLVGAFTHGRVRHGLVHAMVLLAVAAVWFPLSLPDAVADAAADAASQVAQAVGARAGDAAAGTADAVTGAGG